ncbi:synaptopodin-2 isoform X3 [Oryzias melastigma]|uniref:Synaptopodin 2 n=2 Tax=Oryzias melastigma TaxID=30732 RepID=A0A3B3BGS1_ORYME|nr:synaptopodin-2 isoform X3 [Oryzias melastigma]
MFKKHRQRAKKYTLVSYGTGEDEQEYSDEEDEDDGDQEIPAPEITFLASINSEPDKPFFRDAASSKCVLSLNLDNALLDIERNLHNQAEMESLPDTKGKGALMFAQRRQRMDEISAEHEELRRQGMPVEGVQETNKRAAELSYMQSTTEGHTYMDVNMHQQSQQQYQQYQEQQYYEQQQNYQQQHQYQQFQQQQQYEQSQYQQQQIYQHQQQQQYHQEQKQMQQYSANINGMNQQQTNEIQSSLNNRTAKPFTAENMVATPYSHGISGTSQDLAAQGEQIASRDERISTPAIKTSFLLDARRRNTGKPMFTFKESPKMSPNPELLNLLNRSDKKLGFESGPEEDYLSLGAEACNFLQSQRIKPKIPPPVAPKPVINPNSPPWSPQIEAANQNMPQCAENSISTPAVAPVTDTAPPPELEPTTAPAVEHSPPLAPHETPASAITDEQHAWAPTEPESQQQPLRGTLPEENVEMKPSLQLESSQKTAWIAEQTQTQQQSSAGWHSAQVQPQEPPSDQTPTQLPWVTHQPTQNQAQPQAPTSAWTPQSQPNWSQPQGQSQSQPQPPWIRPQEEPQSQQHHQVQPSWAQTNEQPQSQQIQPAWLQAQGQLQQQAQNQWAHPSQMDSQQQAPWVQQPQQKPQVQPPWVQQVQQEPQPPWVQQPQHQVLQQSWAQAQASHQHQQTWVSGQPQQQTSVDAWGQSQTQVQVQPPWIQAAQPSPQPQPQPQPQANLNPWAPVPAQPQSQSPWAQHPLDNNQHHMNSWSHEQNQAQHQPPWTQTPPTQSTPYPGWQQQVSSPPPQPQGDTWPPAQAQLQTHVDSWTSQSQQTSANVSVSKINNRPSPKPWQPQQNASQNLSTTPPSPPRRMQSFTIGQRPSLPVNPMATVLNPKSSPGSAFEMPVVKGKGADMFAKRQSRMEKFVVDSDTVEANKASRSTSPAASLPNEWKYTPNVRAPPPRAYNPIQSPLYPPAASKQPPAASPSTKAKKKDQEKQTPAPKPLNVIDVMKHQPYQLDSSLFIFGPGAEAVKPPIPKPSPPNPPADNQPITYGQIAPVQQPGPYSSPYPQQAYGMPMQPPMHDGLYQQTQANVYPYQQPPGGLYQQQYNQQYQQPVQPAYHPQSPQPSNPPYSQPLQAAYQPANSPPYMAPPPVPYEQQSTSCYITPTYPVVGRADSVSGGSNAAAPRPKFTANKSSAQVWKPAAAEKE